MSSDAETQICPCCGMETGGWSREVRLAVPDAILALPGEEQERRTDFSDGGDRCQLDGERFFVRSMLPVRLTNGHEYHFNVWIELSLENAEMVWRAWAGRGYEHLSFEGVLANAIPPWGDAVLGAQVAAAVRTVDSLPYITSSVSPALHAVLTRPWAEEECLELIRAIWGDDE